MKVERYTVLVGMDFSDLANQALLTAFDLTWRRENADVHVVSVVPAVIVNAQDPEHALINAAERLRGHVQAQLELFEAGRASRSGSLNVISHVRSDLAARAILQLASDLGVDLIVLGTHARQGIERLLLGSVAAEIVRYARCPVLVVPPKSEALEIRIDPPCPECVRARTESAGREFWCGQHREHHGRRHTYHQSDRAGGEANFPLVFK